MSGNEKEKYLELSCDLSELERIKACIFEIPVENGIKKKIFLACDEIFSNITNYSGAKWIQFCCIKNTDKVTITFTDNGIAFNPLESKIEKDFEDFDLGGMGINLVKELCSHIDYSNIEGKNILSLEFTA
ncbi:ATP-binding protein [Blautia sp. HCP3S3_H10_1]|uniref:ATP-binding protein n=1 Tax=unclassified Blautia TaxID=2648079 RepID=UPI003F8E1340